MGFFGNIGNAVKKAVKDTGNAVAKGAKDTGKAVVKGAVDTGHVAGAVAKSDIGQGIIGAALAASGVGLIPAVAIGAGVKSTATLIAPGGNLGKAGHAAIKGAELGAGAAVAGAAVRTIASKGGLGGFKSTLLGGKNALKPVASEIPTEVEQVREVMHPVDRPAPLDAVQETTQTVTKTSSGITTVEKKQSATLPDLTHIVTDKVASHPVDSHAESAHTGPAKRKSVLKMATPDVVSQSSGSSGQPPQDAPGPVANSGGLGGNPMLLIGAGLAIVVLAVVLGNRSK